MNINMNSFFITEIVIFDVYERRLFIITDMQTHCMFQYNHTIS